MSPIRRFLPPLAAALAALLGACGGGGDARPNVLLVSIDTLRADHLSAWGYPRATSPRIDELCDEGVRCADAVSTTSWTMPAHLSMLTGLEISAHGMCDDRLLDAAAAQEVPLPLHGTFLAELLRARGYATGGFYSWKYLEPVYGFDAGFDVYERVGASAYDDPRYVELSERTAAGDEAAKQELRAWLASEPERFDQHRPTSGEAVDLAVSWLDAREAEEPWFLFVHLFDVHDDYVPPPPYDALFTDPDYAGPIDGRNVMSPNSAVHGQMAEADLEQLKALYDGEIAWVDSQVGRLLDHLETLGVADDTLVVLTSDHGEEFFEHGNKGHRNSLFVESVHVPLVFRLPSRLPAGRVVEQTTGIVDIVPTVCELVNVPPPSGLSGRSLVDVLEGDEEPDPGAPYVTELFVFPPRLSEEERQNGVARSTAPTRHVGLVDSQAHHLYLFAPGAPTLTLATDRAADPRQLARPPAVPASGDPFGDGLRVRVAEARMLSQFRATGAAARSEADLQSLEDMGYASAPLESAEGIDVARERLCLDGCVWPDE